MTSALQTMPARVGCSDLSILALVPQHLAYLELVCFLPPFKNWISCNLPTSLCEPEHSLQQIRAALIVQSQAELALSSLQAV